MIINPDKKSINLCVEALRKGNVIGFPTDTVYGIGADAFNKNAIKKIYDLKNRPYSKPLIIFISNIKDLEKIALNINKKTRLLINKFWPGALTLILRKRRNIDILNKNMDSIAVRIPDNKTILKLIKESKCFLATTSANKSGQESPKTAFEVYKYFKETVPYILDGGNCKTGIASTIIDVRDKKRITILREGSISKKDIKNIIGDICL